MELSELAYYAKAKYRIQEQFQWSDFPGYSVLCHPRTGKWVALLMRGWDTETGTQIERCDLKCGTMRPTMSDKPYLSAPIRMRGPKWIGVTFDRDTDRDVVLRLFDRAVTEGEPRGYVIGRELTRPRDAEADARDRRGATIVLDAAPKTPEPGYRDTPLPFSGSSYQPKKEVLPERLRQMRRMFGYGRESLEEKAKNFRRQGRFMEDYEDTMPWQGDFFCYFPTYQDLTTRQLRGYFTWRAGVRQGDYQPISTSAAYLYVYELLNGIGAKSPEDSLEKLSAFEAGFLDAGIGDSRMRQNLRRWMLEYAVIHDLPPERARQYADPAMLERDRSLAILRDPAAHSDEEVCAALCAFGAKHMTTTPVLGTDPERGRRLISQIWRLAASDAAEGQDLFTLCFGRRVARIWYPLSNAVVVKPAVTGDRVYVLDEARSYRCTKGVWTVEAYDQLSFRLDRLRSFLHETDRLLRRYLKTGRYLKERPEDAWAAPFIEAVIEADRQAALEAKRPKITIDLSGLDQIRADARTTRDSLLTEEDRAELAAEEAPPEAEIIRETYASELPLDEVQRAVLRTLLQGGDAAEIIRENHLMPSVAADAINEVLYDELGDVAVLCEDDTLSLVEDYEEDILQLLGGT